jgi:hypothetical protein
MHFAACGAIMATIPITPALASPTSPSSYQQSCRRILVDGATLSADCRKRNGDYKLSSILIRGIFNDNGVLKYTSNPTSASSYQSSCRSITLGDPTLLRALCRKRNGDYFSSSIRIRGIYNNDGNLTYSR